MANHDFGSPCECRECRTESRTETCVRCGFKNAVDVVGTATFSIDRKGIRGYDVTHPSGPAMDLACRKCGHVNTVPFYTEVDEQACAQRLERDRLEATARPCDGCGERVEYRLAGYEQITLTPFQNQHLCRRCLPRAVKKATPDPSNDKEKFEFNERTARWELSKIRVACETCGKLRWIAARNEWKRQCGPCYSGTRTG